MRCMIHYKNKCKFYKKNHDSDNKLSYLPTKNWPPD